MFATRLPRLGRSLHTAAYRPLPTSVNAQLKAGLVGKARGIATTPPAKVNPSSPVADGGQKEAPHSGINVDTPVRMDT